MTGHTPPPPAGWYSDPGGAACERWWDGWRWTASTRPIASPAAGPGAGPGAAAPGAAAPSYAAPEYAAPGYAAPGYAAPSRPPTPYVAGYAPAPPIGVWRSPVDTRPIVNGMGDAARAVFAKFAVFDGRASRSEYWWFFLFTFLITVGATILILVPYVGVLVAIALWAWGLALIVPTLALTVRRLRDAGLHWAWVFISLVPLGGIALLVMMCLPSKYP